MAKEIMPSLIQPRGFIMLRILGALIFTGLYHFIYIREKVKGIKDFAHLFAAAFFGVALNMVMFFEGLSRTSPVNASLIMVTTPIVVLIVGALVKTEKFTLLKLAGVILGTTGAALLISGTGVKDAASSVTGDIMVMINAASYAVFLVMVKPLMKKYDPLTITLWTFIFGALIVAPFGWVQLKEVQWALFSLTDLGIVFYTVFCTTFLAYTLNAWALRYVNSSVVGSYIYLQPILASIVAVTIGQYTLQISQVIFALMIFTGLYLVSRKKKISADLQH